MTIDEVLAKVDKKTRDRFIAASSVVVEKTPTASLGLNHALQGGLGKARQTMIWGNKSAGKSGLCLQTIAEAQKQGASCGWIDAEGSIDPLWCSRLGVDTDELLVCDTKSIHDMTEAVCDLLTAKLDIIVVDSINSLLPSTYFEKNDEMKDGLEGTRQIGTQSKELGVAINKFNYANKNTTLIMISQARNQFNTYGASLGPSGGEAMKFYSSTIVKVWATPSEKEQILGQKVVGDKIISTPIGRKVTATVQYNKIGPPNQVVEYDFYYAGDYVGIDQTGEVIKIAEDAGEIIKGGAWYTYEDQKIQGKHGLVQWFKENPTREEELRFRLGL